MEAWLRTLWKKGKFALPVLGLGVLLLLWPSGDGGTAQTASSELPAEELAAAQQKEMERILARIDGAGEVHLMLTLESDGERTLAADGEETLRGGDAPESGVRRETVILSSGGSEEVVVTQRRSPVYRGALVVCQGADRAEVKLAVTQAVAALTGLGADRITVVKCQ